jgi:hypothetical protein
MWNIWLLITTVLAGLGTFVAATVPAFDVKSKAARPVRGSLAEAMLICDSVTLALLLFLSRGRKMKQSAQNTFSKRTKQNY